MSELDPTHPTTAPHSGLRRIALVLATVLAAVVLAAPSPAAAADPTISIDSTEVWHSTSIWKADAQPIIRNTGSVSVVFPESVLSDHVDSFSWNIEGVNRTFALSGRTAVVTFPGGFWTNRQVGRSFLLRLWAEDSALPAGDGDWLGAEIQLTVVGGTAPARTELSQEGAVLTSTSEYRPSIDRLIVAPGDSITLSSAPGLWTRGPYGTAEPGTTSSGGASEEVSNDGARLTVTVGEPRLQDETVPGQWSLDVFTVLEPGPSGYTETVIVRIPVAFSKPSPTISRVSGSDRYAGAAAISREAYPDGARVVYVAAGTAFPDALSAAPAAAHEGGPLLLTLPGRIPESVSAEIRRLAPERIVVVGGTAAVGATVFSEVESLAPVVDRVDGANRFAVSRNLAAYAFGRGGASTAFFATGSAFPDALSASAAAGALDAPVILVRGGDPGIDGATASTIDFLGVTEPIVIGGEKSVSAGIASDLDALGDWRRADRYAGSNRYTTSLAVARGVFERTDRIFIASGVDFPDALAGAAWAGAANAPLYIVPTTCLPDGMAKDIERYAETDITLIGGRKSLTSSVESLARCGWGDVSVP